MNYTKHGHCYHPIYKVWAAMKQRCYNENYPEYYYYGGRGISICVEWKDYPRIFVEWALNNGWEKGLFIDRINNDGNYEPDNCQWITQSENTKRRNLSSGAIND